jgi:hypothetical protein
VNPVGRIQSPILLACGCGCLIIAAATGAAAADNKSKLVPQQAASAPSATIVYEGEDLPEKRVHLCSADPQRMTNFGEQQWSGGTQMFIGGKLDAWISFHLPIDNTGTYRIDVRATRAPDYGKVRLSLNGKQFGQVINAFGPKVEPTGPITVGTVSLHRGDNELRVDFVGKDDRSKNYFFGLDRLDLIPVALAAAEVGDPRDRLPAIRVHAFQVADRDGKRPANISPLQVKVWLDFANRVYERAGFRFAFDPCDWTVLRNTALNDTLGDGPDWPKAKQRGDSIAAYEPQKLIVMFRHGPGENATGDGFSGRDYNFVVMPGFNCTWCGEEQNLGIFAHEVGHFLGLDHPFARNFKTVAEAEKFLIANHRDPAVFDGDGLKDTLPDPFIEAIATDTSVRSVTLAGIRFPLQRDNIMGYWSWPTKTLTPQQVAVVRNMLKTHSHRRNLLPVR